MPVISTALYTTGTESAECEEGWIRDARVGRCYRATERQASFDAAAAICSNELGAALVTLATPEEHAFVTGAPPNRSART